MSAHNLLLPFSEFIPRLAQHLLGVSSQPASWLPYWCSFAPISVPGSDSLLAACDAASSLLLLCIRQKEEDEKDEKKRKTRTKTTHVSARFCRRPLLWKIRLLRARLCLQIRRREWTVHDL